MNKVFAVIAEETEYYDDSDGACTFFYLFKNKDDAEFYKQELIDAYIQEFMYRIGCETEEELRNEWLEIYESEIFDRISLEAEDVFRVVLYIEERPVLQF